MPGVLAECATLCGLQAAEALSISFKLRPGRTLLCLCRSQLGARRVADWWRAPADGIITRGVRARVTSAGNIGFAFVASHPVNRFSPKSSWTDRNVELRSSGSILIGLSEV